jgi:hypothetical protein
LRCQIVGRRRETRATKPWQLRAPAPRANPESGQGEAGF